MSEKWKCEVVDNISPYLIKGSNIAVSALRVPLKNSGHNRGAMILGSMAKDGGNLILSNDEKNMLLKKQPQAAKWLRKIIGSDEFLNGKERWCLWFEKEEPAELEKYPLIKERLDAVRHMRLNSKAKSTRGYAKTPHLFTQRAQPKSGNYILTPIHTSGDRVYIPLGFLDSTIVSTHANQMIPNGTLFDFGIITSEAHMDWMRLVAGRLESRYRYSGTIVYNTFPFPEANNEQKEYIERLAKNILLEREGYPDKTLAQLYDPDLMPKDLLEAHRALDRAVDELYKAGGFRNTSERVEHLLRLYEKAIKNNTAEKGGFLMGGI